MGRVFKIGLGLLLVGIGLIAVFGALSGDSVFGSINTEDYVYHELSYTGSDFTDLNLNLDNRKVSVLPSDDDQIKVVYYDTEERPINVTENGSTLDVISKRIPWYENMFNWNFNWNSEYYKVYLYLPSDQMYDANIDTSNGDVVIEDLAVLNNVFVDTSNGDISCENLTLNKYSGETSNGDVHFTDVVLTDDLTVSTSNGRMYFTNVSGLELDGSSSNGRIVATNIEFTNIDLGTSNGGIQAQVIGDYDSYRVRMTTSNGSKRLNDIKVDQENFNTSQSNEVKLHTSNGDVELNFVD